MQAAGKRPPSSRSAADRAALGRVPAYLATIDAARQAAAAIPHAIGLQLQGQRHDAPDFFAAGLIARHIAEFLSA